MDMNYSKNSNLLIAWLAGVLTIIILIAGGFFVYYQFFKTVSDGTEEGLGNATSTNGYQIPMGVTVPGEEETATQTDPTAAWLTFTMPGASIIKKTTSTASSTVTTTQFSFKYPKELVIKQNKNNVILTGTSTNSAQVSISWATTTKSLKDYISAADKISATAWEGKPSIKVVTSTDQAAFDSLPAIVREQKLLAADLSEYVVYFKSSSTVYSIGVIAPSLSQELVSFLVVFINNFKLVN